MRPQPTIHIRHVPNIADSATPARCNRRTGEILINDSRWSKIEPTHRLFILLHEYAHILLDSSDELEVDALAHKMFIEMGYPLSESIKALSRVLTGKNDEHVQRVQAQADRAKKYDNNNPQKNKCMCAGNPRCAKCNQNKTGTFLDQANATSIMELPGFTETFDDYSEDLFGLGKHGKAMKQMRLDRKNSKIAARNAKSDAKVILANMGVSEKALGNANARKTLGGVLGAATSIVGGIFGGGSAASSAGEAITNAIAGKDENGDPVEDSSSSPSAGKRSPLASKSKQKSKTLIIVGIVVGALVLVGTVIYFVTKKKK